MNTPIAQSKFSDIASKFLLGFHALRARSYKLWPWIQRVSVWILWNFGEPLLCFICVYLGVISTMMLPTPGLSLLGVPSSISAMFSPIAAFPFAARTFDKRAYDHWRKARKIPLGVRMVRAYSDGVTWAFWCKPVRRSRTHRRAANPSPKKDLK